MTFTARPALLFNIIVWILVSVSGIYFVLNIKKYVNFGLDLVGGTYITLKVDFDKLIRSELEDFSQTISKQLKQDNQELPENVKIDQEKL